MPELKLIPPHDEQKDESRKQIRKDSKTMRNLTVLHIISFLLTGCGTTKVLMKNCEPVRDQDNHYTCEKP